MTDAMIAVATVLQNAAYMAEHMGEADVVKGSKCTGDDCVSTATCPAGSHVVKCSSIPVNGGDGIVPGGKDCKAYTNVEALAICSTKGQATSAHASNSNYLSKRTVSATCPDGKKVVGCYCHSHFTVAGVCGGEAEFAPDYAGVCKKTIGNHGAKIFALCEEVEPPKVVRGKHCRGDDCVSTATCPAGTHVVKCGSSPANGGDGIQPGSKDKYPATSCKAMTNIAAIAECATQGRKTTAHQSNSKYLDRRWVYAGCPAGKKVVGCYCHSPWTTNVCGKQSSFAPYRGYCKKYIGSSGGRRRGSGSGAGAKLWALCEEAPTPKDSAPHLQAYASQEEAHTMLIAYQRLAQLYNASFVPKDIQDWAAGDDALDLTNFQLKCDGDAMSHFNKGAMALRMEYLESPVLREIVIRNIKNHGGPMEDAEKCDVPYYLGNDARGTAITNCVNVQWNDRTTATGLIAGHGGNAVDASTNSELSA
jgi:hypothetical protein